MKKTVAKVAFVAGGRHARSHAAAACAVLAAPAFGRCGTLRPAESPRWTCRSRAA